MNDSFDQGEITEMLKACSGGNREAMDNLVPLVYQELHRQAHCYLNRERSNHTLQTTALVHEAYLRLIEYRDLDLLALDKALNDLATLDKQQAQIVELRFFSGLNIEEMAEVLKISSATVKRDWNMAKAWLRAELGDE